MNSRGQAFDAFNLLIGAIIALTMLAIIISTLNYFEEKKFEVSRQKFNDGVANAVRQPNGTPLQVKNVFLRSGTVISTRELGSLAGISDQCFDIKPIEGAVMARLKDGVFEVKQDALTTAVITCHTNTSPSSTDSGCEIGCELSFVQGT